MIQDLYNEAYNDGVKNTIAVEMKAATDLLTRAAEKLQDYCTEMNGDLNDSLAMEIEKFLTEIQK